MPPPSSNAMLEEKVQNVSVAADAEMYNPLPEIASFDEKVQEVKVPTEAFKKTAPPNNRETLERNVQDIRVTTEENV